MNKYDQEIIVSLCIFPFLVSRLKFGNKSLDKQVKNTLSLVKGPGSSEVNSAKIGLAASNTHLTKSQHRLTEAQNRIGTLHSEVSLFLCLD